MANTKSGGAMIPTLAEPPLLRTRCASEAPANRSVQKNLAPHSPHNCAERQAGEAAMPPTYSRSEAPFLTLPWGGSRAATATYSSLDPPHGSVSHEHNWAPEISERRNETSGRPFNEPAGIEAMHVPGSTEPVWILRKAF